MTIADYVANRAARSGTDGLTGRHASAGGMQLDPAVNGAFPTKD
jgi:hypothetical protein